MSHKKGSMTATDCGNDGNESVASSSAAPSDAGCGGSHTTAPGIDPATPTPPANLNLPGDRRPLSALTSNSPDSIEDYIRNWKKGDSRPGGGGGAEQQEPNGPSGDGGSR